MTKRSNKLLFVLFMFIVSSCAKPHDGYSFISLRQNNELKYEFVIDTLCTYDTFIACRFSASGTSESYLRLRITATSPVGITYQDTVSLPLNSKSEKAKGGKKIEAFRTGNFTDIQWPYRSNVRSSETGIWTIRYEVLTPNFKDFIHGLGFSYSSQKGK